jgi:glycosyltransferase involved in cell wall biosynthesis
MVPAKGSDIVKYALLSRKFEHLCLFVIDGSLQPGSSRQEMWNTTPVEFRPKVPEDRVAELYADIDVLLAPSVCVESFGLVTREALHCGCWVVASDRGSIGDCVTDGENGYVIDVSDASELIRVLTMIDGAPCRYREAPPSRSVLRRSSEQAAELAGLYKSTIGLHAVINSDASCADTGMDAGATLVLGGADDQPAGRAHP